MHIFSTYVYHMFSPLPACRGTLSLLAVCSVCLSVTLRLPYCPLSFFKDLKFSIWIGVGIIQIRLTFVTLDLLYMSNSLLLKFFYFRTFLCQLSKYRLEIWYLHWSGHYTDQVWFLSSLIYFYMSQWPFLLLSFLDFSTSSLEILTWNFYICSIWPTFTWVIALC